MVDPAEDAHFHWLVGDGQRQSGSEQDLRAALTSATLSTTALVWRAGWAEWLPANRVAELAYAIPEPKRESPLKPRRDPAVTKPPPVPAERMPAQIPPAPVSPALSAPSPRSSAPAARAQPPPPPVRTKSSAPPPRLAPVSAPAHVASPASPASASALPPLSPPLPSNPSPKRDAKPGAPDPNDTLAPSSFGVIGTPRRGPPAATVVRRDAVAPGAPGRSRSPLPTLTEESSVPSATATLRPPGAVPPPSRGGSAVPALGSGSSGSFSFDKRAAAMTPIPSSGPPGSAAPPVTGAGLPARLAPAAEALTPRINEPAAPGNALPPVVNKALLGELRVSADEQPLESTLEVLQQVPPEARRTPVEPIAAMRPPLNSASDDVLARTLHRHSLLKIGRIAIDSRTVVMALSALCGALLVAVVGLYLARAHAPAPVAAAPASALPAPPPTIVGCRLAAPAALIASNIERSVPPYASKVGPDSALALGFAASKTRGVGLHLAPATLDTLPAFEEDGKDAVRGVVPLTRSGSLAFFVDRDDSTLRSAHTVDEIPPFTLGVADAGFSRVVAGNMSLIWALDSNVKITEPRAAAVGAFGYGVTFRRGGQAGAVLLGFVGSDGSKKSELVEIPGAPKFLGTPVIAGSATGVLVAFAGRNAPEAAWKVFVSLTAPGAAPSTARELVTGSGGGAISPTLSALAPDRWLLQWTEGASGQYQVRVQSFAADLSALGTAILVSPKGANAGQGSLGVFTGGAAALFILTTAGHDELWGATLSCP